VARENVPGLFSDSQIGIPTTPPMQPVLKVAPLPIEDWELMAAMALLPLAIVGAVKWLRRRRGVTN